MENWLLNKHIPACSNTLATYKQYQFRSKPFEIRKAQGHFKISKSQILKSVKLLNDAVLNVFVNVNSNFEARVAWE